MNEQIEREKQETIMWSDLRECISYDEWSAREYGETSVDLYTTAQNLIEKGYRKQRVGEWIVLANFSDRSVCTECSICGEEYTYKKGQIGGYGTSCYAKYNFCPNCGARMKGGAECT